MEKKLGLLIGSGVSCAVGYPSMSEITNTLLGSGRTLGGQRQDTGPEFIGQREWDTDQGRALIQDFLRHICCLTRGFYFERMKQINYEDIYYIISQINDSGMDEFENPIIDCFTRKLIEYSDNKHNKINEFKNRIVKNQIKSDDLNTINMESLGYINDNCISMIFNSGGDLSDLPFFHNLVIDHGDLVELHIFTTNHDTLIEKFLRKREVVFCDGFGEETNQARWYDPFLLDADDHRVRLIKLHGSVDWYFFPAVENALSGIAIDLSGDVEHTHDPLGNQRYPSPISPLVLLGTFNKMLSYSSGIYADMFGHFNMDLRYLDRLIISGYGFGDKGINNVLVNWWERDRNNRAVIIHPEPEKLRDNARGAIINHWEEWLGGNQIIPVRAKIENAS